MNCFISRSLQSTLLVEPFLPLPSKRTRFRTRQRSTICVLIIRIDFNNGIEMLRA
ncbi:unnamed protein product [Larinioides sclopetarius]|uniref:Uncharacterized protein n=1 Tax=Larinioides sclopetarius TaxID=280406 RepID=A0AAV1ZQJ7_9ARAC